MFPLAYLITFRCYGTWLHGDERGSVNRHGFNVFGTADIPANPNLEKAELRQIKADSVLLDAKQREIVENAICEVCSYRGYELHAVNARSNHVHVVVSAQAKPEMIMNSFKSYATRHLRQAGLISNEQKIWSRHGSTRYIWKERQISLAVEYTLYDQGDIFPNFDELVG